MPSPRRLRLLSLAAGASVLVLIFYTTPLSHNFYHRTVQAMDEHHGHDSLASIHAANAPPPEGAPPPPVDEHIRADKATLPADRDADGDVDSDDQRLATELKERLKVAEQAAKDNANGKVLKPDPPSEVVGVGSAGGQKPVVPEEKKVVEPPPAAAAVPPPPPPAQAPAAPAAPAAPPPAAPPAAPPAEAPPVAAAVPPADPPKPKEETLSPSARADALLNSILSEAPVTIFSKSYCPYSKRAKALLLDKYHVTPAPHVVELDERSDGEDLQDALLRKTGRRTVPNVLVHGVSLGGADEMVDLDKEGKLVDKFVEVGRKEVKITERL
ncbi:glutaredoxin domain-containing protein [Sarocladium implicatum]|nr:glutaredoxin domain-containing protein [Sarocladium implicatum]